MRGSVSCPSLIMSSEQRRALRIALTFTVSFIAAELLRADLQLTFLAPLVAASLACQPKVPGRVALVLPLIAWAMVTVADLVAQFLIDKPVVLALFLLWVFWGGFTLLRSARFGTLGLLILLVFAIVPQTLIKAPELDADLAWWFALNFALAVAADSIFRSLLPEPPAPQRIMPPPPLLSPLGAAIALLLAVVFIAAMQLPAPGAIIVGIVIVLRSDGGSAYGVILDRLIAALLGGAVALAVWEIIWIAPSLAVLAVSLLFAAWLFSARIVEGGPGAGVALKSLSVLAILIGEGFSLFYEDADDRFGTRLAGVMIGLAYVALVVRLAQRRNGRIAAT
ncbi:MAG TPA: hypothetical protein VE650_08380 [Acetobacteraceae bacterium]|nr:hypothetical protein [Acetobacteraceae bacterium]